MTEASTRHVTENIERTGALIVGRKLFDSMNGWGGKHPLGVPVVVVSHSVPEGWEREGEWFTFADCIEAAVEAAKRLAGDKVVGVNGGMIASQCLDAGLLDEVWVDLVPVDPRRRHAVLLVARRRSARARGPGLGDRGPRRHPPALPRHALSAARTTSSSCWPVPPLAPMAPITASPSVIGSPPI